MTVFREITFLAAGPQVNAVVRRRKGARRMSRRHRERDEVYAVLRYDGFQGPDAPPEVAITVKQVVRSRELAEAEVARLNALATEGTRYWWQSTRLFPVGRSAGSIDAEPNASADGGRDTGFS
jgi:hypothetical protein